MIAGKRVPDAGPVVRAARVHATHVPDQKRPGRRSAVLGVREPADGGRPPSGRAEGVRSGHDHEVHEQTAEHGVPGADDEPDRLGTAKGSLAERMLGPDNVGPYVGDPGRQQVPREGLEHIVHAAVVHCVREKRDAVRSCDFVESGEPVRARESRGQRQHRNCRNAETKTQPPPNTCLLLFLSLFLCDSRMTFRKIFNSAPLRLRRQTYASVYYCIVLAIYTSHYRTPDSYDNIICLDDLLPPSKSSSPQQYQNISFYRLVLRSSSGLTRVQVCPTRRQERYWYIVQTL